MARYVVKSTAVVIPTKDGSERYLYRGAPIDADAFDEQGVQRLLEVGLIVEVEEPAEAQSNEVEIPEGDPSEEWSHAQLDAYAAAKDVDLGSGKNKAEKVAALAEATAA